MGDGLGFGWHGKGPAVTTYDIRKNFDGPIMANVGLTKDLAEGLVRSGTVDLCAFGRLYMSNPDLPERFANNWPTETEAAYEYWWYPTGAGVHRLRVLQGGRRKEKRREKRISAHNYS